MDDWQTNVDAIREQVQNVKAKVLGWLTPAAIALTLLLAVVPGSLSEEQLVTTHGLFSERTP